MNIGLGGKRLQMPQQAGPGSTVVKPGLRETEEYINHTIIVAVHSQSHPEAHMNVKGFM